MRSNVRNESNTGNPQCTLRKSRAFAFGAALLFAAAVQAQSTCLLFASGGGKYAEICPETSTSGSVLVNVNGSWQQLLYYTTDATYTYLYHYDQNLWSLTNRGTGEQWVQATAGTSPQGTWQPYAQYYSDRVKELIGVLAILNQPSTTAPTMPTSAPSIKGVPKDEVTKICSSAIQFQQYYQSLGYPVPSAGSICGQ